MYSKLDTGRQNTGFRNTEIKEPGKGSTDNKSFVLEQNSSICHPSPPVLPSKVEVSQSCCSVPHPLRLFRTLRLLGNDWDGKRLKKKGSHSSGNTAWKWLRGVLERKNKAKEKPVYTFSPGYRKIFQEVSESWLNTQLFFNKIDLIRVWVMFSFPLWLWLQRVG